jgi:Domain of unknown function (DUF397)
MEGWRKSSYSDGNGGNCVEAASGNGVISVRDTADRGGATMSDSDRRLEAIRGRA